MGERVGRYTVGERIGGGGMAEVFAGELVGADGFRRAVAIKRMQPALARQPAFNRLFVREARLAALLSHPGIVSVLDFDRDENGRYYLVMERIHGVDLDALVATGPVPLDCALGIAAQVLRALAYAHALTHAGELLGIVHRDVSPHNIMLTWTGAVKLVDFGVARPLSGGPASLIGNTDSLAGVTARGTLSYMSPEQAHGVELDGRSDVFSTGVVLYELITGTRLFAGDTQEQSVALLLSKKIAAPHALEPSIPVDLSDLCMRMLARDRAHRFDDARAVQTALMSLALEHARTDDALCALLADRFPGRARAHASPDGVYLSREDVPQTPSVVMMDAPARTTADARAMSARTRTAPGRPEPDIAASARVDGPRPLQTRTSIRTRTWPWQWLVIGAALVTAIGLIWLAWSLTR